MKGFTSAILDEHGQPLSQQEEMAHVVACMYAHAASQFIEDTRRKRLWAIVLCFLLPPVGLSWLYLTFARRPKVRIAKIGKVWWVGAFHEFEGGLVFADKSNFATPVRFEVPVPAVTPEEMDEAARQAERLVRSPPILAPRPSASGSRATGQGPQSPLGGLAARLDKVSLDLVARLDKVTSGLEAARAEAVTMSVLPSSSPITQAIMRDLPQAQTVEAQSILISPDAAKIEAQLDALGKLTTMASTSTQYGLPVEELAQSVVGRLEGATQELDKIQRESLVDIFQKLLSQLEKACWAPMLLYYCPRCLRTTAQQLKLNLDNALLQAIDDSAGSDSGQLLADQTAGSLSETVADFAAASRAAIMRLELRTDRDGSVREWRCGLCDKRYDLKDPEVIHAFRVKQELVLPLWDQLWMELSSERAGLLERTNREQRDNNHREHQETVEASDQFAAERRDVKSRLEDLNASTLRAVAIFSSLIASFIESSLVEASDAAGQQKRLETYQQQYLGKLAEIDETISAIEDRLQAECEASQNRHKNHLDFADETKLRSQFRPRRQPKSEDELSIESAAL